MRKREKSGLEEVKESKIEIGRVGERDIEREEYLLTSGGQKKRNKQIRLDRKEERGRTR